MRSAGRSADVVVVGGGIVGAFATYFLARLGVQVTLVERGDIGGEASGASAGNLAPLYGAGIPGPLQELAMTSFELHREHASAIRELSATDVPARPTSRLHLAFEPTEVAELERMKEPYDSAPGFSATWLDREAALELEPRVSQELLQALYVEGNDRIDGGEYSRAVVDAAVVLGARTLRAEVRDLEHEGGRVTSAALDSGRLGCDGVVIASGAWCGEPARWLATPIPVEPIKGELLLVEPPGGGVRTDLLGGGGAVYGTRGATVRLGDTETRAGFDRAPTETARSSILERAARLLPEVQQARVLEQTAGLRPVTPDGLPIVGLPAGWENVCLAVGAGRKGLLLSTGMGRAAAELLLTGATELPVGPCSPQRWRVEPAA